MYKSAIFVAIVFSFYIVAEAKNWPSGISAFWPLDQESGTKDIAHLLLDRKMTEVAAARLNTAYEGPFGKQNTSYSVFCDRCYIGYQYPVALKSSFSIAFYHHSSLVGNGGILGVWDQVDTGNPLFGVSYREPNILEVWGGPGKNVKVGDYPILEANKWNFVALTYSDYTNNLNIYYSTGKTMSTLRINTFFTTFSKAKLHFGRTDWGVSPAVMKKTDALACVFYYETALGPEEVEKLPYSCQTKGVDPE